MNTECGGHTNDILEANIPFAAFDSTHVGTMDASFGRESLLR
jgi:hypothetical protein